MNRMKLFALLAIVTIVAWGCTTSGGGGSTTPNNNQNSNSNENINDNDNDNENENSNENANENENENENGNSNENENENGNGNDNDNDNQSPEPMSVTSRSFEPGDTLDIKFVRDVSCGGQNFNPQLTWVNEPDDTQSFVVIMHDPDGNDWIHWCVFDINAATGNIESSDNNSGIPGDLTNSTWGVFGYQGPCPPRGETHSYLITVYALNIKNCGLSAGNTYTYIEIMDTISPFIIGTAATTVDYAQ